MLLLDLGNTRLKLASAGSDGIDDVVAIIHRDRADFAEELRAELQRRVAAGSRAGPAWLSSVHSGPALALVESALDAAGFALVRVRHAVHRDDLRLAYDDISELGVDRWLAMLGARSCFDGDLLLVSAGTAITIDLMDAGGGHRGGCIAGSPALLIEGLRLAAAHLPKPAPAMRTISGSAPSLFASNTRDALLAGAQGAIVGLIRQALEGAEALLGSPPQLLLTGGGAESLAGALPPRPRPIRFESAVLHGLRRLTMERGA